MATTPGTPTSPGLGPRPFISILVLAYQRRPFLLGAVRSALRQTLPRQEYEVLVVKGFEDPDIDAALRELGVWCAFNDSPDYGPRLAVGLGAARGSIIALMDDDDEFEPEKLERVAAAFRADPELNYYHNGRVLIDHQGKTIDGQAPPSPAPARALRMPLDPRTVQSLIHGSDAGHFPSCIALHRRVLDPQKARLERLTASADDIFLLACALSVPGTLLLDPTALTRYRQHPFSFSTTPNPLTPEYMVKARSLVPNELRGWSLSSELMMAGPDPALSAPFRLIATWHHIEVHLLQGTTDRSTYLEAARTILRLGHGLPIKTILPMLSGALLALFSPALSMAANRCMDALYFRSPRGS